MIHDKKNLRLFIGNEIGQISIYSLKKIISSNLSLIRTIACTNTTLIEELNINYTREYIFACFANGGICVLDLEKLGREKFIKEISNFQTNRRVRTIKNIESDNQLITGDEKGFISIWNLQTEEAIRTHKLIFI